MTAETESSCPQLSVVLAVHDQAMLLEESLPLFLTMGDTDSYEVIVVDDSSTDETPDVLKRMKAQYPHLYTTFLPNQVVFNPNRQQLALTIGAKAAKAPLIMLADISRPPRQSVWSQDVQQENITLVYETRRVTRYQTWGDLQEAAPLILKAERHSGRGHQGRWLKFRRGLYDAVVIPREQVHACIKLFDQRLHSRRRWWLRIQVYWKNMTNRA